MTDFNTRYKLYPYRYVHTAPGQPAFTLRDVYKATTPFVFNSASSGEIRAHDCRSALLKDLQDDHHWDTFILAHGLRATCESVDSSHCKPILKIDERRPIHQTPLEYIPDKLLFHIGNGLKRNGQAEGEFNWPRGLSVSNTGEIIIADTANHRIQTFNQFGVVFYTFGQLGSGEGEFDNPTGVCVTMSGEVMVADSKNRRIQTFTKKKIFKDQFHTNDEPYSIAVDIHYNIIVGTTKRTIELYRRGGKLVNRFKTFVERNPQDEGQLYVEVNEISNTIVACDPTDRLIKTFNYTGDMLHKFEPCGPKDGLACVPAGIHVLLNGHICVCDSLNHSVMEFTEKGTLIKEIVGATDGCGSVQQCAAGPEGHLITTEYSTNNIHCLKMFRFKECECHRYRPGSSKRPETPNRYQVMKEMGSKASQSSGL